MKQLDFSNRNVTLVICPLDMRLGFQSLSSYALAYCMVDVTQGRDVVVFVSKSRRVCKIITADEKGGLILTRYLYRGRFQRLMAAVERKAECPITVAELEEYLDGKSIQTKRDNFFFG